MPRPIHRAVEVVARARETLVFAGSSDGEPRRELELVRALASRQVDGLIVMPAPGDHRERLNERRLGLPMVLVDRPASAPEVDSAASDNRGGAQAAIQHLFSHGHRRIAFLGDLRTIWTAEQALEPSPTCTAESFGWSPRGGVTCGRPCDGPISA